MELTKAETIQMVALITSAYPNHDRFNSEEMIKAMVNVWANTFKDDDARIVSMAVAKHVQTSKWPPSIAEIREIMMTIQCPDLIPPDEAWLAVSDVMYAKGEFGDGSRYLPPLIRRAVESIGWSNLWQMHRSGSIGKSAGYDRVAFMDIYKPLYERERQRMQLAPATRQRIDAATASLSGEGRKMLEDAKQDRKKQDDFFRMIESVLQHQALTTDNSPELLESKEEVQ